MERRTREIKRRLLGERARPEEWCQVGWGRGKGRDVSRGQITSVTLRSTALRRLIAVGTDKAGGRQGLLPGGVGSPSSE